ncbi:hypothetical protein [Synechococcus sp. PCC 7335]|uniref:hypothetical protein n=1 Tax=Synechococcus sp. (strain ATCC 29403 / PCC 7335) TaxID=91464 RepID=UPI001D0CFEE9|nr:hypothetical protein [Synechococcus sp. PCC 7335]
MRALRLLCLVCLLLSTSYLTGCSTLAQVPPDQAIRLAITQQLSQTQQAIANDLGLIEDADSDSLQPNFKLEKVIVSSREKVGNFESAKHRGIQDVYRVRGSFEAKLTHPIAQQSQTQSPFDLYLGTNPTEADGPETWFLLDTKEEQKRNN